MCDHDKEQNSETEAVGHHWVVRFGAAYRLRGLVLHRSAEVGAQNHLSLGVQTSSGVAKVGQLGDVAAQQNVVCLFIGKILLFRGIGEKYKLPLYLDERCLDAQQMILF